MDFAAPERLHALWIAGACLVLALLFARRRRPRVASIASLLLRAGAVFGAVALFAAPFVETVRVEKPRVDVVVDGSRSVGRSARADAFARAAAYANEASADVRVLVFGDGATARDPLAPTAPFGPPSFRSDPNDALSAVAAASSGRGATLILATDGRTTPPDAAIAASLSGRAIRVVPASPDLPRGARLDSVVAAPRSGDVREAVVIVRGFADVAAKAVVELRVDGASVKVYPLDLVPGPFEERFSLGSVEPGRRLVAATVKLEDAADVEPLDDEVGVAIDVEAPPVVLVATNDASSHAAAALRAQGLSPRVVDLAALLLAPERLDAVDAVVLDRARVEDLSTPTVFAALDRFVRRGGGLVFLPEDPESASGALAPGDGREFLSLLPLVGREEPAPKPDDPPPPDPKEPPVEGLKPPDPNKKETEVRDAPTLGLLLLIDASGSMKGQKLRLAQVAAAKAAEVLHEKDFVGVVAFNDGVTEVVPLGPAEDMAFVRSQISRIRAGGNTDFRAALDAARDVFFGAPLRIKHCILLSDGFSTTVGAFSKLARELRESGVTVSTVGVGVECDVTTLSNIAAEGGGKYQGAPDEREVPQLFVVEAERLIRSTGARRRSDPPQTETPPKPAPTRDENPTPPETPRESEAPGETTRRALPILPAWPAAYLKGVKPEASGGVFRRHLARPTRGAWISLKTETGEPVLAHHYVGFGRVAAFAFPLDGPSTGPFSGWTDLGPFFAQLVRFLLPEAPPERFDVRATAEGRLLSVAVDEADGAPDVASRIRLDVRDQRGRTLDLSWRRVDDRTLRASIPDDDAAAFVDVVARPLAATETGFGRAATTLPRPAEIAEVGVLESGLELWARALRTSDVGEWPKPSDLPRVERRERAPYFPQGAPWLLLLFAVDLVLKRAIPGVVVAREKKGAA